MKTIYLAGGCFWGVQKYFDQFDGVEATEVGYANGPDGPDAAGKAANRRIFRSICENIFDPI